MDSLPLIISPITHELEQFKELFDGSLTNSTSLLNRVLEHIRLKNGKMMRPILVLLATKMFGEISAATLHGAVALELLHTASLVHDDVVDESLERRGQSSVNALYDNKIAVLVGDFLLATCLWQASCTMNPYIIGVVARLGQGLSEGELLQLSNVRNEEVSEDIYYDIIKKKTAILFAACTEVAALSAKVNTECVEKARLLGEYIGICFQIKDDIFDYYEDTIIGKPTGNDMREGKLTLPAIYVVKNYPDNETGELAAKVKSGEISEREILYFINLIKSRGGIEYATKAMSDFRNKAFCLLNEMEMEEEIRTSLTAYLNYVVEREK